MTTSCSENDYRTRIAYAVKKATGAELQYRILCIESAASPEEQRKAECQMYQAERDLICVIGGEQDSVMEGRNGRGHSV